MTNPAASNPSPPRRGRPAVLTPEKRQRVLALLSNGCSRRTVARFVECSPATITRTAARDPEFAAQLAQAEAHLEVELLANLRRAAKNDRHWRAAAWLLERKYPHNYPSPHRHLYTPDQVTQLFIAALDSLAPHLPPPHRELAIQNLATLLLQFDPGHQPPLNNQPPDQDQQTSNP